MTAALADSYDLLLVDLDGVVYLGDHAVPGVPEALRQLKQPGHGEICYVTNNASRSAEQVAALLRSLGAPAEAGDVMTSAQAAAELLAERLAPGAPVLVVGAASLADEVTGVGLTAVTSADDKPVAVVQGYSPDLGWRHLAEAAVALAYGALWVATNTDRTLPSPRGQLPGNGAMVAALATATGRQPDVVVGKPEPTLFQAAVRQRRAQRPLVIGDRFDTDIDGAVRAGYASLFVLSGVGAAADLFTVEPHLRPRYVANSAVDLLAAYPGIDVTDDRARCRGWVAAVDGQALRLTGAGEPIDALRALCAAAWRVAYPLKLGLTAEGADAAGALQTLGLSGR